MSFRFRSIGKALRFRCRLNKRRLGTCKSPKRYRLGPGKYHFKVFAVGPRGVCAARPPLPIPDREADRAGPPEDLRAGSAPASPPADHAGPVCQEPPTRVQLAGQSLVVTHPAPGMGVVTSEPSGLVCETFFCGAEFAQAPWSA